MEAGNQLVSYEKEAGGKIRRYYRITKEGHKELKKKKQEWNTYQTAVSQVIMTCWKGTTWTGGELYG